MLALVVAGAPQLASAVEPTKVYEPPDISECSIYAGVFINAADTCVELSGRLLAKVGWDTASGLAWLATAQSRAGLVTSSDLGLAAAVVGLEAGAVEIYADGGPRAGVIVTDAFVRLGDRNSATLGWVDSETGSLADLTGDEPLDHFGTFTASSDGMPWDYGVRLGGLSIQFRHHLSSSLQIGYGVENIDGRSTDAAWSWWWPTTPPDSTLAGTVIANVSYDDGSTTGRFLAAANGVYDGKVDDWIIRSSVRTAVGDRAHVFFAGVAGTSLGWYLAASGDFAVGAFSTALTIARSPGMTEISGSVEASWGLAKVGAAARTAQLLPDSVSQAAIYAKITPLENLEVSAEVGRYVGNVDSDSYVLAGIAWTPDKTDVSASTEIHETGGMKVVFAASQDF
ncbi:MAG: hypothetical protein ABI697_13440 [Devosia sp.]